MDIYHMALFLHVSSVAGLFIGMGIQLLGLTILRKVNRVEQARGLIRLITIAEPIGTVSALLTIASGLYMALTAYGILTGWILVALASIVVFIPPAILLVIEPHMRAIMAAIQEEPDGSISTGLSERINDPVLGTALRTMAALLLGIVFLMTNKPALTSAILAIVITVFAGLSSSLFLWRKASGRMIPRNERVQ